MTVDGAWRDERRDIGAGALFVPIAQPKARLVMSLLEPQAPDSFVSWGYFSAAFERKEYMENYVTEAVARQMLSQDAALKAEFERRLREDAGVCGQPGRAPRVLLPPPSFLGRALPSLPRLSLMMTPRQTLLLQRLQVEDHVQHRAEQRI